MRDNFDRYQQAGWSVYGVNPASPREHDEYVDLFGFPFKLISDEGSAIARDFGAVKENGRSILRSVFVVADGVIRFGKEGMPSSDEILGALAASVN